MCNEEYQLLCATTPRSVAARTSCCGSTRGGMGGRRRAAGTEWIGSVPAVSSTTLALAAGAGGGVDGRRLYARRADLEGDHRP